MIDIIKQFSSELIAGLAVILSAVANRRVVRAEREAAKAQKAIRRMDLLVEIERKNAAVGKLALLATQQILLIQKYPHLESFPEAEINRLRNNLDLMKEFQEGEELQRRIHEAIDGGGDIETYSKTLTDVQRLRVRIEAEVEKETQIYMEQLEKSRRDVV